MINEMTPKERVKAAFEHSPVDRTPVMILKGGAWIIDRLGVSFEELYNMDDVGAKHIVQAYDDMNSDIATAGIGGWMGWLNTFGSEIVISKVGLPMEIGEFIDDIDTQIPALEEKGIRNQLENNYLVQKMMEQARNVKELLGDEKYLAATVAGPFSIASMMVGTGKFMRFLRKNPDSVQKLLSFTTAACLELANMYLENGCDMINLCDPVSSGDMISPKMFDEFAAPCIENFSKGLIGCEILVLHICGKTTMRIPRVKQFEAVDGYSVDYVVDVKEALEIIGEDDNDLVLLGNIEPSGVMLLGTEEMAYNKAYENLEAAGGKGGFILMPGCDLPAKSPLENVLALSKASSDYAKSQQSKQSLESALA